MTSDAISRGARGAAVTFLGQVVAMVVQFVGTVVLARVLTPEDFGLLAMVMVFVGIGELLRDFGMSTAALQSRTLSHQQASNVFWVTSGLSFAAGVLLAVSTPLLVALYDEPRLAEIVPVMALTILLNGLQAQYQVRLARALRFTALVIAMLVSRIGALAIAISAALIGWGYWALVAQQVAGAAILLVMGLLLTRWVPGLPRRDGESGAIIRAGGHFGGAQVLTFASDNADTLMIGSMWGATQLGYYNRAFQLFMGPVFGVFGSLTKVVVPIVQRAVGEGRSPFELLLRAQTALCGLAIWALLVTAVTADWLVPLLLGPQWEDLIPLVQILALAGAFRALSQTNYWAYVVSHQARQLFLSNLVTKPLQVLLIVGAAFVSVEAVAWAFAIGRAVTWPINLVWLQKTTEQSALTFGLNGLRLVVAAVAAFGGTYLFMSHVTLSSDLVAVAVGVAFSTALYLGCIAATPGGVREIKGAVRAARTMLRRGGDASAGDGS